MRATRLAVLDLARGLAVLAMVVYHFSWDLSWFGFVDWQVDRGAGWRSFAALIAGSFLFVSGMSLDLSHHTGIRWNSFLRRLAIIVAAAAAVSLATYFSFGNNYVRFGILHSIAAASIIALPFTRWPAWAGVAATAVFLTLPLWGSSYVFNGQFWLWTGLGTPDFGSVDYVPVAPWAGVALAGLSTSKIFRQYRVWERLSGIRLAGNTGKSVRFMGRHSLPIYLLHQPVLYGLVWSAALLTPQIDRTEQAFVENCSLACQDNLGAPDICNAVCNCTLRHLKADETWSALAKDPENPALRNEMNTRYEICLSDPELEPEALR